MWKMEFSENRERRLEGEGEYVIDFETEGIHDGGTLEHRRSGEPMEDMRGLLVYFNQQISDLPAHW